MGVMDLQVDGERRRRCVCRQPGRAERNPQWADAGLGSRAPETPDAALQRHLLPTPTSRVHWMQKREQERRSLAGYQVPAPRAPADVRACVFRALNETVSELRASELPIPGACAQPGGDGRSWALGRGEGAAPQEQLGHRLNPRAGLWLARSLREARRGRPCLASPFPSHQGARLYFLKLRLPTPPPPPPTAPEPL